MTYNEIDTPYIKYDLCFYAQEHDDRIYLEFSYLTDLFDEATIARMLANFRVLSSESSLCVESARTTLPSEHVSSVRINPAPTTIETLANTYLNRPVSKAWNS